MKGFSRLMEDRIYFFFLEFAGKVEPDVGKLFLRERQRVGRVGQKDLAAVLVERHTVELALAEVVHLLLVVGLDPACLMDLDRLVAALGAVFVLQTVLDDLELQGSDRADDLAPVHPACEQLRDAFVHQLVDTLG